MIRLQQAISARIKACRRAAGFTQEQLSEKTGIAPQHLSRLETARRVPSLATVLALAEALGTTPSALLAEPEEDTQVELISRVTAVLAGLSADDAAFMELQLTTWAARLKKTR